MNQPTHWNILVPNGAGKEQLIKDILNNKLLPELAGQKTELYAASAIARYIREEELHDLYVVTNERGQPLKSMSSGERKKALLRHILQQKPDVLILDNPLDSLDVAGRTALIEQISQLATDTAIVNIVSRKRDFLALDSSHLIYQNKTLKAYPGESNEPTKRWFAQDLPAPISEPPTSANPLIDLRQVSVSYSERPILQDITWQIAPGAFWQLKGPNGAGKTTLLTMITGDNHKGYGQDLTLFGYKKGSGESVWDIKKNIGYYTSTMTHDFWRHQSIEYMVISGYFDSVGLYQRPSELQLRRTKEWLELIGLEKQREKPFVSLPVGWRRLVLIVRAMVKHPPLLILDEPTSDLDDENTALITELINKIANESNTAILYVSHQDEPGLQPEHVFELIPTPEGSAGKIL
ncbi:ATP-binding cassette domain-containing protein [Marinoscillum furvescens]|uniref:Molybdate transport system ATP-binding protein n=1 Tax=Marinoscillum furvescens DSM 4134 TaxID=1122208 RepID=A0A3D9L1H2_MARFU|nr:ATP-binding cassette domain-containing protein [Marinoscillum furvescens]RED96680.1 molybdate transport system ATP-binding protein [Marinoscillum furvescens DSM 4134]